jgi:chromosomal replication initiation ATPase DnaA
MTLETATTEQILAELSRREKVNPNIIKMTALMHKVAEVHNVTVNDIRGCGQHESFVRPRHQFCVLAMRNTSASISLISKVLDKDITAIRRAEKLHEDKLKKSAKYRETWKELLKKVKQ